MGWWSTATTLWRVGHEYPAAWTAAMDALAAGASPVAAAQVFADATEGALDDAVVAEVRRLLGTAIDGALWTAHTASAVAGCLETHRETIVAGVDRALGVTIDVGWHARAWASKLATWR